MNRQELISIWMQEDFQERDPEPFDMQFEGRPGTLQHMLENIRVDGFDKNLDRLIATKRELEKSIQARNVIILEFNKVGIDTESIEEERDLEYDRYAVVCDEMDYMKKVMSGITVKRIEKTAIPTSFHPDLSEE